jgi:hypothetical protein
MSVSTRAPLKLKYKLEGGSWVTVANMHRIRVRSKRLCTSVIHSKIDPKSYHESYVVVKDKDGYRFVEVTHGMGICGSHKTLRGLVAATLWFGYFEVYLEDEQLQERRAA